MKIMLIKRLLFIFSISVMASCGSNKTSQPEEKISKDSNEDVSQLEMFKATDCATCHKMSETFVGPSLSDIAIRYKNAADTTVTRLAATIINGSSGRWQNTTAAMTPHPAISATEAESMVKFILQLKK